MRPSTGHEPERIRPAPLPLTRLIVGSVPDVMADAPYTGADVRADPFSATPGSVLRRPALRGHDAAGVWSCHSLLSSQQPGAYRNTGAVVTLLPLRNPLGWGGCQELRCPNRHLTVTGSGQTL